MRATRLALPSKQALTANTKIFLAAQRPGNLLSGMPNLNLCMHRTKFPIDGDYVSLLQ